MIISLSILLIIAHLIGLALSVIAIWYSRTSQGAFGWAIFLNTMPYIAIPLYLIFGSHRFHGYTKARRSHSLQVKESINNLSTTFEGYLSQDNEINQQYRCIQELCGQNLVGKNSIELLIDGEPTFSAIIEAINSAKNYVLIEFFIIKDDQLGGEVARVLKSAASRGVKVLVLYDAVGSHDLSNSYKNNLLNAGVVIKEFRTTKHIFRLQVNFRNHRKLVIVDGHLGFTGGLNIGDEYMGRSKRFGHWRDTFISVQGPAVAYLQLAFYDDWLWASNHPITLNWSPSIDESAKSIVTVIPASPADIHETGTLYYGELIRMAKQRIWISSPYLVPDKALINALLLAVMRGVDVRIIIPSKKDHFAVFFAAFYYIPILVEAGVKIYRYKDGFLHEKVTLIDDRISSVGSMNFDLRSGYLNFEVAAFILDKDFNSQTEAMLQQDISDSHQFTIEDYHNLPWHYKIFSKITNLFAPIL